jgi:hypothetical protein
VIFNHLYWGEKYPVILNKKSKKKKEIPREGGREEKKIGDRVLILGPGERELLISLFVCICCENP